MTAQLGVGIAQQAREHPQAEVSVGEFRADGHGSNLCLDGNGALLGATEQADLARAIGAAVAKREAAAAADVEGILGVLTVRARDHEAVFVVGDGHLGSQNCRIRLLSNPTNVANHASRATNRKYFGITRRNGSLMVLAN